MQKLEQHHIIENLEEHAENLIKKGLGHPCSSNLVTRDQSVGLLMATSGVGCPRN